MSQSTPQSRRAAFAEYDRRVLAQKRDMIYSLEHRRMVKFMQNKLTPDEDRAMLEEIRRLRNDIA